MVSAKQTFLEEVNSLRLKIELGLKNKTIHINYKSKLQGLIYAMLKNEGKTKNLHDVGYRVENRPFKLFVFSDLIGESTLNHETKMLTFVTNAYFEVSSIDEDMMIILIGFLQNNSRVILDQRAIDIIDFSVINPTYKIKSDTHILSTISPVTIYKTSDKKVSYISPEDPLYTQYIIDNIEKKYAAIGWLFPKQLPTIKVVEYKKRSVYFRKSFFEAYNLVLEVSHCDDTFLQVMLKTGIGSKNSMGFGMLKDKT